MSWWYEFSIHFQLYEHHTKLMGWTWPPPCTVCCHPSNARWDFLFLFFSRHNVNTLLAPCYNILAALQLPYFPLSFSSLTANTSVKGWTITQCSLLCQDDFKQVQIPERLGLTPTQACYCLWFCVLCCFFSHLCVCVWDGCQWCKQWMSPVSGGITLKPSHAYRPRRAFLNQWTAPERPFQHKLKQGHLTEIQVCERATQRGRGVGR